MAPIDDAVAEINSLDPSDKLCYTKIASKHGVERSTLSRRHRAVTQSHASKTTNQQKLTPQQEAELVN
ncbi:hypothetical protein PSPO01_16649 [Paraphaeosphaeria sporulosa]